MEKLICPACGSNNLVKSNYHEYITENLGDQVLIEKVLYKCTECGSEGDFFNENELSIERALSELKSKLVVSILDGFTNNKVSLSSIERALELPQRTLTKWKNGASSPTSAGIALLKFIKLFPWLLEVAENKFNYEISQRIFMSNAFQKMINKMKFFESEFKETGVITTANSTFLYIHMYKKWEDINNTGYANVVPMVTIS